MLKSHIQYPQKLNIWAGILNDVLIGPFFIDGDLTAEKYEVMLRDQILPTIRQVASENFAEIWYQQDSAPPHYDRRVRAYLDTVFHNRWIGKRGEMSDQLDRRI